MAACLRATQGHETTPARTLRARAFLRLGRPAEARSALRGLWLENDVVRGEVAMLQGAAAARLGEHARAGQLLLTARAYVFSTDAPALEAELECHSALIAFGESDLQQVAAACRRLLRVTPLGEPKGYIVPLRHVRARAFELLGLVRAARGNYAAQALLALQALEEFGRSRVPDAFQEAHHVASVAGLVRDLDLADRVPALRSQVEALGWTSDTAEQRFQSREALAWCAALHGDQIGALRYFRRAAEGSTTLQYLHVGAARALLAFELEQRFVAAEEIGHALDIAERFHWQGACTERLVLLSLAQAAAPLETARARAALERYTSTRAVLPASQAVRVGDRARAREAFAEGVVARAEGNIPLALHCLRAAFECWTRIEFRWRAARAAIELVEMGEGETYREALRRELSVRPSSWIAKRAALAVSDG